MNIIIICGTIIIICLIGMKYADKKELEKTIEQSEKKIENIIPKELTEEEYKNELLNNIRGININLVELQNQIDKQKKMIDDIKFCINLIAFLIFIPFILKIIALILGMKAGTEFLQYL